MPAIPVSASPIPLPIRLASTNTCAISTDANFSSARRAPVTDKSAKFVGNFWVRKSAPPKRPLRPTSPLARHQLLSADFGKLHVQHRQRLSLRSASNCSAGLGGREMATADTCSPSRVMSLLAAGTVLMGAMLGHALLLAPTSHASVDQDQRFYSLLTDPDQSHPMVIWDFPVVSAQGMQLCQQADAGATPMQALYHLDRRYGGPYVFDDASSISSAATVVYCPWHGDWPDTPGGPQGVNESRPIYPEPIYPALIWPPGIAGGGGA